MLVPLSCFYIVLSVFGAYSEFITYDPHLGLFDQLIGIRGNKI